METTFENMEALSTAVIAALDKIKALPRQQGDDRFGSKKLMRNSRVIREALFGLPENVYSAIKGWELSCPENTILITVSVGDGLSENFIFHAN